MRRLQGFFAMLFLLSVRWSIAQPSGYSQSAVLWINHTKVSNTDQPNFPVLIATQADSMKGSAGGGCMQSPNAYDIVFSSDNAGANLLPYQRLRHDLNLGRVVYYVRVPTLSHAADTPIYIWCGNASVVSDQSNPAAVWDANYKAVWHLNENANSATINDSTANGHTGTFTAVASTRIAQGKLPNLTALSFTPSDHVDFASAQGGDFDFTAGAFTFSYWVNITTFATYGTYFGNGKYVNPGYYFQESSAGGRGFAMEVTSTAYAQNSTGHQTNSWYYITVSRNGNTMTFYLNGSQFYTSTNFANPTSRLRN